MSEPDLFEALARIGRALDEHGTRWALVGGLAVSVRGEVRFTRDVDLAVSIATDDALERLVRASGHVPYAIVQQDAVGRIATVRLVGPAGVAVDLIAASSGIEPEVVAAATTVDLPGIGAIPCARAEELFALKVLALSARRKQDEIDLEGLYRVNPGLDLDRVRALLDVITRRGFHREQDLQAKLASVLAQLQASP